jgi:hypothetical protein
MLAPVAPLYLGLPVALPYNGAAGGGREYFARAGLPLPPRRPIRGVEAAGLWRRFRAPTVAAASGRGYA